jgi:hypothetical protein
MDQTLFALPILPGHTETARAFRQFAASRDEFDRWFKERVLATTGADLNTPPPGPMSTILTHYLG